MKIHTSMDGFEVLTADRLQAEINSFLLSIYGSSLNTQRTYSYLLQDFSKYCVNNIMTAELLERFIIHISKNHRQSSVNLYINAIKSLFNYLETKGYKNLAKYIHSQTILPPEQRCLSKEEYEMVCSRCRSCQVDLFKFLCNTGLRVSELVTLRRENVSNGFIRVIGKGRKARAIPMNQTVKSICAKYPNFEFCKKKNRTWVFRYCKKLSEEAQIPKFHPHSCRHYFANELYHRGVPMQTVSRLLGHSCTMVTENVYVHWGEECLKGITDILGLILLCHDFLPF